LIVDAVRNLYGTSCVNGEAIAVNRDGLHQNKNPQPEVGFRLRMEDFWFIERKEENETEIYSCRWFPL
jgi:hypothetical protein